MACIQASATRRLESSSPSRDLPRWSLKNPPKQSDCAVDLGVLSLSSLSSPYSSSSYPL